MKARPPASPPCSAHEVDPDYMWAARRQKVPATNSRFCLKRAYSPPSATDGTRVLVERLWPRGLAKDKAAIDQWMKNVAPSTDLRKWYGHRPDRWPEFAKRYREELRSQAEARAGVDTLARLARDGRVTLVFAARDEARNSAVVLKEVLNGR
jgi:uncharacterized protein YeaO (DUF488 family)